MSNKVRRGFSIRTKLTLVALLLLLIPLMSYIYVRDMKSFLIKGQENALSLTARAVSTVLHDRPELFDKDKVPESEKSDSSIYVVPLANYIRLDGNLNDWGDQLNQASAIVESKDGEQNVKIRHLLGYRGSFLYALFDVSDESLIFRGKEFLRTDNADHIRLTIKSPNQSAKRYALTARQAGRMSVYAVDREWVYPITRQANRDLLAHIRQRDNGYIVELRIPRFMIPTNAGIQLQIVDVDNPTQRNIQSITSTTNSSDTDQFSRVLLQTPEIDKILKALNRSDTRIWVLDSNKRVRTVVGNLSSKTLPELAPKPEKSLELTTYYYKQFMGYIFNLILEQPSNQINDLGADTETRNDRVLEMALSGESVTDRRPSIDNQTVIVMAANPIWSGDTAIGAVVVEQSSNEVLSQQREALENVISVTLLVLIIVLSSILFFASRLTLRIRRLRDAADNAIDKHGRIKAQQLGADARTGDEVGDLSRSISAMLNRLSQYTSYLKGLPDTLSHEVSNPLNVVNSSLHNMVNDTPELANSKYFERAQNGLKRIRAILTNLTEAANLEQAMEAEKFSLFDIVKLVQSYVEGYQSSNPDKSFSFRSLTRSAMVDGTPDHIAQMLDKLVDNAMDFAISETDIVIRIRRDEKFALIDVINEGSELPTNMQERIFEPMVSLGRKDAQKTRLGMGLYVVKLIATYHGGHVTARNLRTRKGVIFTVALPIAGGFIEPFKTPPKL